MRLTPSWCCYARDYDMADTITVTAQARADALVGGLLSVTGSWTVHLGTSSAAITFGSEVSDFSDPFYPEYTPSVWTPTPIVTNLDGSVMVTGSSCTFAAPSLMPQLITDVWVTYTDSSGQVRLLEAWIPAGAPFAFGPGGPDLIVNVGFKDF
jgi:hypothetical protein